MGSDLELHCLPRSHSWDARHIWIKNTVHGVNFQLKEMEFEPPHDKTNKVTVCPAKTQISLGIRPVLSESSGSG